MPEQHPARGIESSQSAYLPANERRGKRRVRVSLQLRIRPLEFCDGNFEEVRMTVNLSRNSLYFFTKRDRYCRGLGLRITPADGPVSGSDHWEDRGEVVRVGRKGDGFGVAVLLSPSSQLAQAGRHALYTRRPESASGTERRGDSRWPFVAPAELVDIRSGVRV